MVFSKAGGMGEKGKVYQNHVCYAQAGQSPLKEHLVQSPARQEANLRTYVPLQLCSLSQ